MTRVKHFSTVIIHVLSDRSIERENVSVSVLRVQSDILA